MMNGYSTGRDVSLDVVMTTGQVVRPSIMTGFTNRQETQQILVRRLDGITDPLELPDGWGGSFDYERQDDTLDSMIATLESNYYSGLNVQGITITQTVRNPNGSISQYRFVNVVLKLSDGGEWGGDKTVKQKLDWRASRRLKIQ